MEVRIIGKVFDMDEEGKIIGSVDVEVRGDGSPDYCKGDVVEAYNEIMEKVTKEEE